MAAVQDLALCGLCWLLVELKLLELCLQGRIALKPHPPRVERIGDARQGHHDRDVEGAAFTSLDLDDFAGVYAVRELLQLAEGRPVAVAVLGLDPHAPG